VTEPEESAESVDSLLAAVARIPQTWTPPSELDEYRLLRPLGRGGMGSVWLAEDLLLDRLVAIKFIAHAEPDVHTRERFNVEARAAARLAHVNVVTVYRFGEIAGRPYLVSEYIRGDSLDKLAKPMPWQTCLEHGIALARGLAAAHRSGIVHRDIKPANAILAADGEVKLVDFGLAKIGPAADLVAAPVEDITTATTLAAGPDLTQPGTIAGTPRYLSPEVRAGAVADRRSDVYQVGSILYELATGRAPIMDATDGADVTLRLDADAARFAVVVERCLRRDPEARFATGDELREALERLAAPAYGGELPEGNPYRGLVAFDAEHRALFFGRGAEIRAVIERLRADPFVLVTGDSGVGKSSLCRAGIIPNVLEGALGDGRTWTSVSLVPGQLPVTAIASALARALELDEARLATLLSDTPGDLPRELRKPLGPKRGLLVFVDQLEEITTLAKRDEATAAAQALHQLAGIPGVRLLATVRSDFLTRVAELPAIGGELARALYLLPPLSADGAREAIVGPARAKGAKFESEQLVDTLVAAVADTDGSARAIELPLLAFTLAQLWDARDLQTQTISARSLEAIGGVRGALARHADGVLDTLLPAQRDVARRLLLRLVTAERTRARRNADELAVFDRSVLDALVRGRLVVARGTAFELAHERLIDGWPTLAGWLSENVEAVAAHARLAIAAADWERLDRARERLWGERQLVDLARLATEELTPIEAAFGAASRRVVRRRKVARIAVAIAIPLAAIAVYAGTRFVAQRAKERRIDEQLAQATPAIATARQKAAAADRQRKTAFAAFDAGDAPSGEAAWRQALVQVAETRTAYTTATRALEAALTYDTTRGDVRHLLTELMFERVQLAERELRFGERDELEAILALYDRGEFVKRLSATATLRVEPRPGARLGIVRGDREVPLPASISPGSYVLIARADGRAVVRIPIVLHASEERTIVIDLPPASAVPDGFVYVPPGRFLYGSRDEEPARLWFTAVPMHERETPGYLIARTETTYAQWLEYLDSLPAKERDARAPKIGVSATIQEGGGMELARDAKGWRLRFAPANIQEYRAYAGERIVYRDRTHRREQDWLRMPISGISPDDALAYVAWLDRTKRVPRARLCAEDEWERAARGADGRSFPHGEQMTGDDANVDETYGRREGGFGMDEVGSHPVSASPFGLLDMSGNVWEITRSGDQFVMRGGGFYTDAMKTAHLANRNTITPDYRHLHLGLRICADL